MPEHCPVSEQQEKCKMGLTNNAVKYNLMTVKQESLAKMMEIAKGIDGENYEMGWQSKELFGCKKYDW